MSDSPPTPSSSFAVAPEHVGVVVIGRNEATHIRRAFASVGPQAGAAVYADSESTDDSVAQVRTHFPDVEVVQLRADLRPLTPAGGRNAGYAALRRRLPEVRYVMFLDGDCELMPQWLSTGAKYLHDNPDVGVVTGRLRERYRDRNVFHRLADMEWDLPPGEIEDMGGIMMVRTEAWDRAGGQNPDIPAAEEREFLRRVRAAGYRLYRLTDDMALHDIDMERVAQWWTRAVRAGHSYAQGYWVHRDRWHLRHVLSYLTYGAALPGAALAGAPLTLGMSLSLLGAYPRLWKKLEQYRRGLGDPPEDARIYASAMVAGKIAGAVGVVQFFTHTLRQGRGGRREAVATEPAGD